MSRIERVTVLLSDCLTDQRATPAFFCRFLTLGPPSFPSLPDSWHCFVGRNFGSYVTHEASKFIYFYIGQMGVCLFSTA